MKDQRNGNCFAPTLAALLSSAAILLVLIVPVLGMAQQPSATQSGPALPPSIPKPIKDNSLLIEEAYNQEFGVVQHINTFTRDFSSHSWIYTFTQGWPVPDIKHQVSYILSAIRNTTYERRRQRAPGDTLECRYHDHSLGER
jgi:hypothetical protein